MLKFGVHKPETPAIYDGSPLEDRVAFPLLRTAIPPSQQEVLRFESIMRCLRLPGGVYRTTAAGRFAELDRFFQPLVESRFARSAPLHVEDWAVSAGITSAEWFENLSPLFPGLRMVASDLHLFLVEVLLPEGGSFVVDTEGHLLQYIRGPFVIPMHRLETARFPVNRWLQRRAQARFEELRNSGLLAFDGNLNLEEWQQPPLRFRKIPLMHPTAVALSYSSAGFRIESHSVFEPVAESCDVIRTMNIFNRSYFDEDQLRVGAQSVWQSLSTDGLWLVGRTVEEQAERPQHASVFAKTRDGFSLVARATAPSEIEALVLTFRKTL